MFAFGKGVRRVTIRTTQIAGRQPDKNARQPRESALTLQAEINFVDDEVFQFEHRLRLTRNRNLNRCSWIGAI